MYCKPAMKAKRFQINMTEKTYKEFSPIANEGDHLLSGYESSIKADIQPQKDYVACIKISRQPNGKILGASVFIPAEFIQGIVGSADSVNLKISLQNNNIKLSV